MTSTNRADLSRAVADLTAARERLEAALASVVGAPAALDLNASQTLRRAFANSIALDTVKREEQAAAKKAEPTTRDKFAEALGSLITRPASSDD